MTTTESHATLDPATDGDRIQAALDQVCESDQFVNADRLKDFLTYVVAEAIAGRSGQILGKTIAQDVYSRGMTGDGLRDNLVRVDAGRLRRKLRDYYEGPGRDDPVRIHMDSGGYAPRFEDRSGLTPASGVARSLPVGWKWIWVGAGAVCLVLALGLILDRSPAPIDSAPASSSRTAERKALARKSAATVHADNLCHNARALLFPINSPDNQKLASDVFRQAIKVDPNYVCGYAGLGHSLSTASLLTPPGEGRAALSTEALQMAERAVDLAPTSGWSQSALAWAHYASGDRANALTHSALAEELAPTDGNVLDFRAITLLVLGDFEKAYDISHPDRPREKGSYRFAHRNIHAVASFHLGKYQDSIASLNYAAENGDPVSALSLVFLAAGYMGQDKPVEAKAKLTQLKEDWPSFNAARVLGAFYANPEYAADVLETLRAAGWEDPA